MLHDAPSVAGICHAPTLGPLAMVVSVGANLWVLAAVYGGVAPELVWIGVSAVVLTLVVTSPLARWARGISQASRASGSATTDELEEGLRNVAAVQSLGGTERQRGQFAAASQESFRQSLLLVWVVSVVEWIAENVHLVFATAGFWVIFSGIVRGELTLGDTPVVIRMYSLLYETLAMPEGFGSPIGRGDRIAGRRSSRLRPLDRENWRLPLGSYRRGIGISRSSSLSRIRPTIFSNRSRRSQASNHL